MKAPHDDSREADERAEARRLCELRARVKAARVLVETTPAAAEAVRRDWRKAAQFYAQFGITESMLRYGVPVARSSTSRREEDRCLEASSGAVSNEVGDRQEPDPHV